MSSLANSLPVSPPVAYAYLKEIPPERWSQYAVGAPCYGYTCSSLAESFHSWLLPIRELPLDSFTRQLLYKLYQLYEIRLNTATRIVSEGHAWLPRVREAIQRNEKVRSCGPPPLSLRSLPWQPMARVVYACRPLKACKSCTKNTGSTPYLSSCSTRPLSLSRTTWTSPTRPAHAVLGRLICTHARMHAQSRETAGPHGAIMCRSSIGLIAWPTCMRS